VYECVLCVCVQTEQNKVGSYTTAQTNLIYLFIFTACVGHTFYKFLVCSYRGGLFIFPILESSRLSHPMKQKKKKEVGGGGGDFTVVEVRRCVRSLHYATEFGQETCSGNEQQPISRDLTRQRTYPTVR
jgi:hypothetical protein